MPREPKLRRIASLPACKDFSPDRPSGQMILRMDELEALRLSDLESLDQRTASAQMEVSRGTYQRILGSARRKVAEALVEGKSIKIGGGNCYLPGECTCVHADHRKCPHPGKCEECKLRR